MSALLSYGVPLLILNVGSFIIETFSPSLLSPDVVLNCSTESGFIKNKE